MSIVNKKGLINVGMLSALTLGLFAFGPQEVSAEVDTYPVSRIEGKDRFETAALISSETYESADTVVIANAMNFADALSGVPLAYQNNAPILLAHGTKLKASIVDEINRLGATKAIILGGQAAVSSEITQQLKNLGLATERLAGDNRFETSAVIAEEITEGRTKDTAVVVDGMEFADAMSIAPFAARDGMPIYLTKANSLSNSEDLKEYSEAYIVGGENAVSNAVEVELNNVTRIQGLDRYETNREVIKYFGIDSNNLFVATGLNFADALTGSVAAAANNSTVALVKGDVHSKLLDYLDSNPVNSFMILGGKAAVSDQVTNTLESYINKDIEDENTEFIEPNATYELSFNEEEQVMTITVTAGEMTEGFNFITMPNGEEITEPVATYDVHTPASYIFYIYDNDWNLTQLIVDVEFPETEQEEEVLPDPSLPVEPTVRVYQRYVEYDNSVILEIHADESQGGFSHIIMPDGSRVENDYTTYRVYDTNEYVFEVYDQEGNMSKHYELVEIPVLDDSGEGSEEQPPVDTDGGPVVSHEQLVDEYTGETYLEVTVTDDTSDIVYIRDSYNLTYDNNTFIVYFPSSGTHTYEIETKNELDKTTFETIIVEVP